MDIEAIDWRLLGAIGAILLGATLMSFFLRRIVSRFLNSEQESLKLDKTRLKVLRNAISLVVWCLAIAAIVVMIPELKAIAVAMFASAGILVLVIGIAARDAFSNIIGGIFIILFKPFRVGDMIQVGSRDYGIVEDVTLRHTVVRSFKNKRIIVPNSVISHETIVNDSIVQEETCRWVEFGISYDSDLDMAIGIIQDVAAKHPLCIDTRTAEQIEEGIHQVVVRFVGFGDSSLNLRAYIWTADPFEGFMVESDISMAVKKAFDEAGIEIPFPYRTIVYKKNPDAS